MKRYIVSGSVMEYMAHYQCLAESADAALRQWQEQFPDCPPSVYLPSVSCVEDSPWLEKHWRGHGDRFYAGGYRYYI
jgi:hypothetical protein